MHETLTNLPITYDYREDGGDLPAESRGGKNILTLQLDDELMLRDYLGKVPTIALPEDMLVGEEVIFSQSVSRLKGISEETELLTADDERRLMFDIGFATTAAYLLDLYPYLQRKDQQPFRKTFLPLSVALQYIAIHNLDDYLTLHLDPESIKKHENFVSNNTEDPEKGKPSIEVTGIAINEDAPWPEHLYEKDLQEDIQKGEKAIERFVTNNTGLIGWAVMRYYREEITMDREDLKQEGVTGLLRAISGFDIGREYKFSTYATNWVVQAVRRAIANQGRNIRVPVSMYETIGEYVTTMREIRNMPGNSDGFYMRQGKRIDALVCERMNINSEQLVEIKLALLQSFIVSTDLSLSNEGEQTETTVGDLIPGSEGLPERVLDSIGKDIQLSYLQEVLELTDRDVYILKWHMGFTATREHKTLLQIGKELGISKERTRQLEAKIIKKINKSERRADIVYLLKSSSGKRVEEDIEVINRTPQQLRQAKRGV